MHTLSWCLKYNILVFPEQVVFFLFLFPDASYPKFWVSKHFVGYVMFVACRAIMVNADCYPQNAFWKFEGSN